MTIPFGPQLIGETEKTLNALLRRALAGTDLTEPAWVTLRLAGQSDAAVAAPGADLLAERVRTQAHFDDARAIVAELTARGLLADGRLTDEARRLVDGVQQRIATMTAPVWADLPSEETAAAARILNEVASRARAVLRDHDERQVADH